MNMDEHGWKWMNMDLKWPIMIVLDFKGWFWNSLCSMTRGTLTEPFCWLSSWDIRFMTVANWPVMFINSHTNRIHFNPAIQVCLVFCRCRSCVNGYLIPGSSSGLPCDILIQIAQDQVHERNVFFYNYALIPKNQTWQWENWHLNRTTMHKWWCWWFWMGELSVSTRGMATACHALQVPP